MTQVPRRKDDPKELRYGPELLQGSQEPRETKQGSIRVASELRIQPKLACYTKWSSVSSDPPSPNLEQSSDLFPTGQGAHCPCRHDSFSAAWFPGQVPVRSH